MTGLFASPKVPGTLLVVLGASALIAYAWAGRRPTWLELVACLYVVVTVLLLGVAARARWPKRCGRYFQPFHRRFPCRTPQ